MALITFEWTVDGALADADTVELSNSAATFGVRRTDSNAVLVAAGADMTRTTLGRYEYEFTDPEAPGLVYEYYVKVTYDGDVYYIQNFQEKGGEEEGVARVIRAMFLNSAGEPLAPSPAPELSSPTATYGAKRLDDGVTVIPASTEMSAIGTGYYATYLTAASASSRYRFYVHAVINNVSYYLPGVSNGQSWSVALAFGRYTNSYRIGQMIGHDNLYLWAGTPQYGTAEADEPVDFAYRISEFIRDAEDRLDQELLGAFVSEAFDADAAPAVIRTMATAMAAVAIYESRGVDDVGENSEGPTHRMSATKRQLMKDIRRIKMGLLSVGDVGYGPSFGFTEVGADD